MVLLEEPVISKETPRTLLNRPHRETFLTLITLLGVYGNWILFTSLLGFIVSPNLHKQLWNPRGGWRKCVDGGYK